MDREALHALYRRQYQNFYVVIELHTGIMDGRFSYLEDAESVRKYLNQKYKGVNFCVFECLSDIGDFDYSFPPEYLCHENTGLKLKWETI